MPKHNENKNKKILSSQSEIFLFLFSLWSQMPIFQTLNVLFRKMDIS